jgi:Na+/proline symporter
MVFGSLRDDRHRPKRGYLYIGTRQSWRAKRRSVCILPVCTGQRGGFYYYSHGIAATLLPLKLTSIYSYIEQALGTWSYKTAAGIFLLSRTIGSSFRLYLVVIVLQKFIFDSYGVPFAVTVLICLVLIWSYTFKGGLKTIIITDSLQTLVPGIISVPVHLFYLPQP